jgi:hypothetical protein
VAPEVRRKRGEIVETVSHMRNDVLLWLKTDGNDVFFVGAVAVVSSALCSPPS